MRPRPSAFLRNLALFLLSWTVLPGAAEAQAQQPQRVVVENFRGPAAGRVRSRLVSNLQRQDGIELVSRADVRSTARELGIRGRSYSDDEYVQIARELNIAAFVDGRTNRRRRRWALTVRVRSGADGMVLGSESWGGRTVGSLNAIGRNGYRRLEPHLSAAQSPAPQNAMSTTGVTQVGATGDTPWYAAGSTDDTESVLDLDEELDEDLDEPRGGEERYDGLRVSFLAGSLHRSMAAMACVSPSITVGATAYSRNPAEHETCSSAGDLFEERTYQSGGIGHFEAGLAAEVFPGALLDEQVAPWLGVAVSYRHSLGLNSFGFTRSDEQIEVPTSQSELYVGGVGHYRLTPVPYDLEARVQLGWGMFDFELDPATLEQLVPSAVIPPVTYQYILLGLGLSFPVVPTHLRLGVEGGWRLGLGVGAKAKEIWGVKTTDMSGFGIALRAVTEMPYILDGLFAGLRFEYFRFTTTYRGQTACVADFYDPEDTCTEEDLWEEWPHQDGDPNAVTGGITDPVDDDYMRLTLEVGYAL